MIISLGTLRFSTMGSLIFVAPQARVWLDELREFQVSLYRKGDRRGTLAVIFHEHPRHSVIRAVLSVVSFPNLNVAGISTLANLHDLGVLVLDAYVDGPSTVGGIVPSGGPTQSLYLNLINRPIVSSGATVLLTWIELDDS